MAVFLFVLVLFCGSATAATINVNNSTSNSLQNTITNAHSGDTLNLSAGTYKEHDVVINKNLIITGPTVTGATPPKAIIDGQNQGRVFTINSGVNVTLQYLIISNGLTTGNGGGIYNAGNLTVKNSTITNNNAGGQGGGLYNDVGNVTFIDSKITYNKATGVNSGGIFNHGTMNIIRTAINFNSGNHNQIGYDNSLASITIDGSWQNPVWQFDVVDSPGDVGRYTSLAVDSNNNPHILYYDAYVNAWKYAYKKNGIWYKKTIDNASSNDDASKTSQQSIVVDKQGNPHVLYPSAQGLKYAYIQNGTWHFEIVDSNGGTFSSIALDSEGNPHICYRASDGTLYYRFKSDWGWSTPISTGYSGNWIPTAIAIDKKNNAHIAYYTMSEGVIYLSQGLNGYNFYKEVALSFTGPMSSGQYRAISMVLDNQGKPHITVTKFLNDGTYFEYLYKDTTWHEKELDPPAVRDNWVGRYNSIATDANGNPNICYYAFYGDSGNFGETSLRYLTKNANGQWNTPQILDTYPTLNTSTYPYNADVGEYCSIALDSNGNPCISYYDKLNKNLIYAYYTPRNIVTGLDPANNAVNVPANKTIKVTFSENIKAGTLNITLKNSSGTLININKSINGNILTITPTTKLAESLYTLTINRGALTDLDNNPLAQNISKFSAGNSPTITSTNPTNGAIKVARNKTITINFNEAIRAGANYNKIVLKSSKGTVITITKTISGKTLIIKPSKALAANTRYTLTLYTGSIIDLAGNPQAAKTITFTTGIS